MKTSDYISVVMIAIVGTILAYFLTNSLLGDPAEKSVSFEYMEKVDGTLTAPDGEVFNLAAINPTVEVYIGNCEDTNKDGILDDDELRACGEAAPESSTGATQSAADKENEAINKAGGYASGTTAEQRQAVQNSVNEFAEQQKAKSEENATGDEAARRETTSTGN